MKKYDSIELISGYLLKIKCLMYVLMEFGFIFWSSLQRHPPNSIFVPLLRCIVVCRFSLCGTNMLESCIINIYIVNVCT